MSNNTDIDLTNQAMLILIVPYGRAEKMAHFALDEGASSVTAFAAHGTVPKPILRALGLDEVRRELLVITLRDINSASALMGALASSFNLKKKNTGIAFSQPLLSLAVDNNGEVKSETEIDKKKVSSNFKTLVVIVDRDDGVEIVDIAHENDARGATIVEAWGSADHSRRVFDFVINPRKDLVLLVSESNKASELQNKMLAALRTTAPGRGISFMHNVSETVGIDNLTSVAQNPEYSARQIKKLGQSPFDHKTLFILVDRNKTKDVVQAAEDAGNLGATILHGRGIMPSDNPDSFFAEANDIERSLILMVIKKKQIKGILKALHKLNEKDPDCAPLVTACETLNYSHFSYTE